MHVIPVIDLLSHDLLKRMGQGPSRELASGLYINGQATRRFTLKYKEHAVGMLNGKRKEFLGLQNFVKRLKYLSRMFFLLGILHQRL